MESIYIFGHRNPDTDTVAATISLSYLKNQLGVNTKPKILGSLNHETKFVLDYFKVEEPVYLNDVKLQIRDVNYHKGFMINEFKAIKDCYNYITEAGVTGCPIVDCDNNLLGLVTLKIISKYIIKEDFNSLETSYDNLLACLSGREFLKFNNEISGNIVMFHYDKVANIDHDSIVVADNYHEEILMGNTVIFVDYEPQAIELEKLKEYSINVIVTTLSMTQTVRTINLANYVKALIEDVPPVSFDRNDYVSDFLDISAKYKHTNYPVTNKENKCLGLLRIVNVNDNKKKQVILVDHNEKIQSVEGLEEAEIIEVVDHHKLGDITTKYPINFRNMAVGSTNTIIYSMYLQSNVQIPNDMAGVMISGILSDTLLLKSPTTTIYDIEAVNELCKILNIDYRDYGLKMLKAGTSLKNKTKEEIINSDTKMFNVDGKKIAIMQVFTTDYDEIKASIEEYVGILNQMAFINHYSIALFFVTDVVNNGSYMIYNQESHKLLSEIFDIDNLYEGYYMKDIMSRKKQIIPPIIDFLEKM